MKQTTFTVSLGAVSKSNADVAEEGKKRKKGGNLVILIKWRICLGPKANLDLKLDLNVSKLSFIIISCNLESGCI